MGSCVTIATLMQQGHLELWGGRGGDALGDTMWTHGAFPGRVGGGALGDIVWTLGVFSGEEDALGYAIWTPRAFLVHERSGDILQSPQMLWEAESTLSYITLSFGLAPWTDNRSSPHHSHHGSWAWQPAPRWVNLAASYKGFRASFESPTAAQSSMTQHEVTQQSQGRAEKTKGITIFGLEQSTKVIIREYPQSSDCQRLQCHLLARDPLVLFSRWLRSTSYSLGQDP